MTHTPALRHLSPGDMTCDATGEAVHVVAALPLTALGKVDKQRLREDAAGKDQPPLP